MNDRPPGWLRPLLGVGESVYGAAVQLRSAAFEGGFLRSHRVSRPVISVGNIAVGGSGKTPFVVLLAARLTNAGRRVAVLSRGYGRRNEDELVVVSEGEGATVGAALGGDEPVLIADRTSAVVVVSADRVRAAQVAIRDLGAEVLLLDDGFQHFRLQRDLDVVMLDRTDPFSGGRLLPMGRLREPPESLARADLLVLVGEGDAPVEGLPDRPIVRVVVEPTDVLLPEAVAHPDTLAEKPVALLSAIARPERFAALVEGLGGRIVLDERLRDHAPLSKERASAFMERATAAGAELFLTTEKDAVRMGPNRPEALGVLRIAQRIAGDEEVLDRALERVLA